MNKNKEIQLSVVKDGFFITHNLEGKQTQKIAVWDVHNKITILQEQGLAIIKYTQSLTVIDLNKSEVKYQIKLIQQKDDTIATSCCAKVSNEFKVIKHKGKQLLAVNYTFQGSTYSTLFDLGSGKIIHEIILPEEYSHEAATYFKHNGDIFVVLALDGRTSYRLYTINLTQEKVVTTRYRDWDEKRFSNKLLFKNKQPFLAIVVDSGIALFDPFTLELAAENFDVASNGCVGPCLNALFVLSDNSFITLAEFNILEAVSTIINISNGEKEEIPAVLKVFDVNGKKIGWNRSLFWTGKPWDVFITDLQSGKLIYKHKGTSMDLGSDNVISLGGKLYTIEADGEIKVVNGQEVTAYTMIISRLL